MTKALELAKFGRETPPTGVVVGDSDAQTLSSKTFSDGPVFSGLNANGVPFLNASKVLSSSSIFVFDGTNLGIGIASPAATLHVNASGGGTIRASRSSVGGEYVQLDHDGTDGTLRVSGNNRLNLITNGINRIIVTGGGNVGIGGALPLEVLSVINSNYESFGLYRNLDYNSVGAMGARMFFGGYVGSTATRSAAIDGTLMTATTGRLSFSTLIGGTLTESMRIETNGSVRIGGTLAAQSASAEKLTVDGVSSQAATLSNSSDSYGTVYLKNRSTTAATIQPYLYFNDGSGANRGGFGVKYTDASVHQFAQGGINWYVGSAGFSGLAATLTSTGLLINNTAGNGGVASAPVHVSASGLSNTYGTLRLEGANRGGILEMYNSIYPVSKIITDQSGNFAIQTSASFATSTLYDRLTIGTSGDVQIATSTNLGGGRLDLTSNATAAIQARSAATGTGDGTADVTVLRAVTAGATWWANARYDAYSHTWGRGDSASATTGMTLTAAGRLGIGTTNPTNALTVVGDVRVEHSGTASYGLQAVGGAGTANDIFLAGQSGYSNGFTVRYTGTRMGYTFQDGIVGINKTDPITQLDIATTGAVISGTATIGGNMAGIRVHNSISATPNNAVGLWFATGPHQAGIASFRADPNTDWGTAIAFYTHGPETTGLDDCSERVRIDGRGRLGIGTTNPTYPLTVNGPPKMTNSGFNFNSIDKDASSGSVTFTYPELGGGMDNLSALIMIHVYQATGAVPGKSAIWIGTRQAARGYGGSVTQISSTKEYITTLTVATSGDSTVVTTDGGANLRCRLTIIAGGGTSVPQY